MYKRQSVDSRFEDFVGLVSAVGKEVNRIKAQEMRRFGLKGTDVMCLYYLEREPAGYTASELARLIGNDRAAVSRTVAALERGGFVGIDVPEGGTRYKSPIRLTERGLRTMREVNQIIEDVVARAAHGVDEPDRAAMYRALGSIRDNLSKIGER